jgi:hypothetical protein
MNASIDAQVEDFFFFFLMCINIELSCSNYVDHHVSTKEQITLQDTMAGVVYSTSQFGLDG